jgi:uncharacterized protein
MPADLTASVDAGSFGQWLAAMRAVLRGEAEADVPCGDCIGCCISSYPIPLRPEDVKARAEVPEQFLLGATATGERWMMGFREDGSCPFMQQRQCGIYASRPQTCRDYDCRLYAAAGLVPDGNRAVIEQRVREWRFSLDSAAEQAQAEAVRRAAHFIRDNALLFAPGMRARSATAAAVLAVKTYPVFLAGQEPAAPDVMARRVVDAARAFDAGVAKAGTGQQ